MTSKTILASVFVFCLLTSNFIQTEAFGTKCSLLVPDCELITDEFVAALATLEEFFCDSSSFLLRRFCFIITKLINCIEEECG